MIPCRSVKHSSDVFGCAHRAVHVEHGRARREGRGGWWEEMKVADGAKAGKVR